MTLILLALALLLTGCATAADIKPGVVKGLERGYLKTSEGLAMATRGCQDEVLWQAALEAVQALRLSDWRVSDHLIVLQADAAAGRIDAVDRGALGPYSYVGVFLHPRAGDTRLIEVSSFWRTRMTVTENPWELALIRAIEARVSPCIVPAIDALREPGVFRGYSVPIGRPIADPSSAPSDLFCRQRANSSAGWDRSRWLEEYRRCMAGY